MRMSKIKQAIFLMILFGFSYLTAHNIHAELITVENSKEKIGHKIGSKVLNHSKEKLIFHNGKVAKNLIYVTQSDYKKTLKIIRKVFNLKFGEANYHETKNSNFHDDWVDRFGSTTFNNWTNEFIPKLKAQNINLNSFNEARIVTKRYNVIKSGDGYTKTTIRIINGKDIFNLDSTIVLIKRVDSAKQWGWHNAHNPFSFGYKRREYSYITETELNVINEIEDILKANSCQDTLPDSLPIFAYFETWKNMQNCIKALK